MVINIASLTGEHGYPCSPLYASSKAAVVLLERVAEIELAEFWSSCARLA
jgi:NAD(P)-dependent dehydrogenase (short-subunit alcohol dehydrogenase family)